MLSINGTPQVQPIDEKVKHWLWVLLLRSLDLLLCIIESPDEDLALRRPANVFRIFLDLV